MTQIEIRDQEHFATAPSRPGEANGRAGGEGAAGTLLWGVARRARRRALVATLPVTLLLGVSAGMGLSAVARDRLHLGDTVALWVSVSAALLLSVSLVVSVLYAVGAHARDMVSATPSLSGHDTVADTTPDPVRSARRQATVMTLAAASIPTVLAAEGMIGVAHDVLRLVMPIAVSLAAFLELALVASALHDRVAALENRPGRFNGVATWVFSALSGGLSALHELISTEVAGSSQWQVDPQSLLAAAVRLAAPLVAAWLWHKILSGERQRAEGRTLSQIRRDRRLHQVSTAALAVRRLEESRSGSDALARARTELDRRFSALLRTSPATEAELEQVLVRWLSMVGAVDQLPTLTGRIEDRTPPGGAAALLGLPDIFPAAAVPAASQAPSEPTGQDARGVAQERTLRAPRRRGARRDTDTSAGPGRVGDTATPDTSPDSRGDSVAVGDTPAPRTGDTTARVGDSDSRAHVADSDSRAHVADSDSRAHVVGGDGDTVAADSDGVAHVGVADTDTDTSTVALGDSDSVRDSRGVRTGVRAGAGGGVGDSVGVVIDLRDGAGPDTGSFAVSPAERLQLAIDAVREHGDELNGRALAAIMTEAGHPMTDRTAQRWITRAQEVLAREALSV